MEQKYSSIDDYFAKNKKFSGDGDANAKKLVSCWEGTAIRL